jgi:dephospho-CoA kinase
MRIGIAGYMGAGKTTCARLFCSGGERAARIIDADAEAKALMARDREMQERLRDAFGGQVIDGSGVRSDELGRVAFASAESLLKLNSIVHPPLVRYLEPLVLGCTEPICILDAALIPLLGIERWFDLRVWVDASFETRFERLKLKRGDLDEGELVRRMKMQEVVMTVPESEKNCWVKVGDADCYQYIAKAVYQ